MHWCDGCKLYKIGICKILYKIFFDNTNYRLLENIIMDKQHAVSAVIF